MGRNVYLDANFIIRLVESEDDSILFVLEQAAAGIVTLITSELTLAEVLVGPVRERDRRLIRDYEDMFADADLLEVQPVNRPILVRSAELRAALGNKLPDSIHVATAIGAACEVFLSSDRRIRLPDGLVRISVEDADDLDKWP